MIDRLPGNKSRRPDKVCFFLVFSREYDFGEQGAEKETSFICFFLFFLERRMWNGEGACEFSELSKPDSPLPLPPPLEYRSRIPCIEF